MPSYKCINPECNHFGCVENYYNDRLKFVDGKFQSVNIICPSCGQVREEYKEGDIPLSQKSITFAKYSSSSKEEKTKILKKRSHEHYKKEIEPFKQHQLQQTIKNFKDAGKM